MSQPRAVTVELMDGLRPVVRDLLRDAARRLAHLAYADLRIEIRETKAATAENGASKFSGDDYGFTLGVRVLAGDRAVAPGYVGLTLGAADLGRLPAVIREAIERAHRRALVNAEMKADARGKFGRLGEALADTRLCPIAARQDTVPAEYEVDPRAVRLGDMVAYTTDVSRQVGAPDSRPNHHDIATLTQLSRELFASTDGALIDQAFALTQGLCSVVGVAGGVSQE